MLLIDGFLIDAEISSEHLFENEVTDHPVEVGADITDHSRAKPIMLTIEGVVSDTPLASVASERTGVTLPSADALARLTAIREAREPIAIATSLRRYDNMLMQRLSITKDVSTGRALRFTVEFKQVILATNERVVTRTAKPSTKGKSDRGNKSATPVPTVPPKAVATDTTRPPPRRVPTATSARTPTATSARRPTAVGGSGYSPSGKPVVRSGGSGIPTRVGVRESPL